MREAHPIDDLFRRTLENSVAEPPAGLGAAIIATSKRRRRAVLWWRWASGGVLLAVLLGGALLLPRGEQRIADTPAEKAVAASSPSAPPAPSTSVEARASETRGTPDEEATQTRLSTAVAPIEPAAASKQKPAPGEHVPQAASSPGHYGEPSLPSSAAPVGAAEAMAPTGVHPADAADEVLDGIDLLALHVGPSLFGGPAPEEPRRAAVDYFRDRGQWWVGPMATLHFSRNEWKGGTDNLVDALNGSNRPLAGVSFGAMASRRWAGGLGLWLGAEADWSSQDYRSIERREEVQHEAVVTQMVTLNAQVVFTDFDTLESVVVHEARAEAKDERISIRVPVEVSWWLPAGRWRMGPRAGFNVQHTRVRSSVSLALDSADGFIRARQLSPAELRQRHPLSLSGTAGLDAAYLITDRLSVVGTPFLTLPIATMGDRGDAWAEPHRFGFRFLLMHRF